MFRTLVLATVLCLLGSAFGLGGSPEIEVEISILQLNVASELATGILRLRVINRSDRPLEQVVVQPAVAGENEIEGAPFAVAGPLPAGHTSDTVTSFRFPESTLSQLETLLWKVDYLDQAEATSILVPTRETTTGEEEGQ